MTTTNPLFARRVIDATQAVFGDSPLTAAVSDACERYTRDLENIQSARGIGATLLAIVGAKGQGKTWVARQLVRDEKIRSLLRSGDLQQDATTRLVWIGPVAPESLDPETEVYHPCNPGDLIDIGQTYVLLDTPGQTDANARAAELAKEALSLAPIKLLVVARDQLRSAANMHIAAQINGSVCIPIISSVEPAELADGAARDALQRDLRDLRDHLIQLAPKTVLASEVLVPDFEIVGDESASGAALREGLLERIDTLGLDEWTLSSARERRITAAGERLHKDVGRLIGDELPQLAEAVEQLARETENLPERVLDNLLGSESVLETGVRIRLRARLISDTSLLWFPYRTIMSTLNLTQGAWDRVMLAMAGSVPSLFGALASWARNWRQNQEFNTELQDGIRSRTQQQVEERLRPLCHSFHRTVMKLRPRAERSATNFESSGMRLAGIEELQTQSQRIFDSAIHRSATRGFLVQLYAFIGVALFWCFMAGPIVLIYREYFMASVEVFTGQESKLEDFPHPTPGLLFTSLFLSMLPLAIYCMAVLTWSLSSRKVRKVAKQIVAEHQRAIVELKSQQVIRLDFEDPLLSQTQFLLGLSQTRPAVPAEGRQL